MKLPFFGYTIFIVERISEGMIPVPCFFGVNKEEIIAVDVTTQVCQTVPLDLSDNICDFRRTCEGRGWTSLHHSTGPK